MMQPRGGQFPGDRAGSAPAAGAAAPPAGHPAMAPPLTASGLDIWALLERTKASISQSEPKPRLDALGLFRASIVR